MKGRMAAGLLVAFALASASEGDPADRRSGGGRAVGRAGGSSPGARSYGGGHAVRRGQAPPTAAQRRHPRAGTGTGGYYGRGGYGRGYGHHPYHDYYSYYRYYPYWGYYPFPGYGLPGLGLSFYYGEGYTAPAYNSAPYYSAPYYYAGPPAGGAGYYGGGGGYGTAPAPEPPDAAVLLFEVVPDDASVWIDDQFRGVARDLTRLALPPGRHRVEVVRPGFRTVTEEIDLGPGTATTLRIELERP